MYVEAIMGEFSTSIEDFRFTPKKKFTMLFSKKFLFAQNAKERGQTTIITDKEYRKKSFIVEKCK
jgi:hypothetical protein